MKINGSPLLYGRTYMVDFGSQFLAQPNFFSKSDAEWAFSIVSNSMDHSDFVGRNGRRVIFGNGRFVVVGLVTVFEELFKKCGREPVFNRLDHERGRAAYGFIGIVIARARWRDSKVFDVPTDILLDLYCEMIAPVWDRTDIEEPLKISEQEICVEEVKHAPDNKIFQAISLSQERMQPSVFVNDEELCDKINHCVLSLALKGSKIVFCSNADEIRVEYRRIFDVVTCANPESFVSVFEDKEEDSNDDYSEPTLNEIQGYDRILMSNPNPKKKAQNEVTRKEGKNSGGWLIKGGWLKKEGKNLESNTEKEGKNSGSDLKKEGALSYDDILAQGIFDDNREEVSQPNRLKKNRFTWKKDC